MNNISRTREIKFAFIDKDFINQGQMVQINNAWNDKPVPYGVEALRCSKDNKSTSLEIMLVDVLCDCSWYVLNILMVLFIMAWKKVSETNRESVRSHSVLDMSARPLSRAGVLEDWLASRDSKTTGSFSALLRIDLNAFYNVGALVMGKILLCSYLRA